MRPKATPAGDRAPVDGYEAAVVARLYQERVRREALRRLEAETHASIVLPEPLTLQDHLARPRLVETPWRIEGWMPLDSRIVLAGPPKAGKTTLLGSLLRTLIDGDPWLGSAAATPITGKVALLDLEMPERKLMEWLERQAIRGAARVLPLALRGRVGSLNVLDPDLRGRWAAYLRDQGVTFLLIDPLRPLIDALGLDEHRDGGRVLTAIDTLLAEAAIPEALISHHFGHKGERARGDSRYRDWPDCEWRLLRKGERGSDGLGGTRYLDAYGRDVDQPETALEMDAWGRIVLGEGDRAAGERQAILDAVVTALAAAGPGAELPSNKLEALVMSRERPRKLVREAIHDGAKHHRLASRRGAHGAILYRLPSSYEDTEAGSDRA